MPPIPIAVSAPPHSSQNGSYTRPGSQEHTHDQSPPERPAGEWQCRTRALGADSPQSTEQASAVPGKPLTQPPGGQHSGEAWMSLRWLKRLATLHASMSCPAAFGARRRSPEDARRRSGIPGIAVWRYRTEPAPTSYSVLPRTRREKGRQPGARALEPKRGARLRPEQPAGSISMTQNFLTEPVLR